MKSKLHSISSYFFLALISIAAMAFLFISPVSAIGLNEEVLDPRNPQTGIEDGNTNKAPLPPSTQNPGSATTPAAQSPEDGGGFVPCGNTVNNPCNISHLFRAFVAIINYMIVMAGFVAVFAIVYAGFLMVASQGQEQLKAAKGHLSGAVIGLVVVAVAFVLINSIFSGSLSLGVCDGGTILSNPKAYIQTGGGCGNEPITPPAKN